MISTLISSQDVSIAIHLGALVDSSLIARKLCTLAMVVCASPGYLEKYGTPREPRDLVFHNCLAYTNANPRSVWTFVDQNGDQNSVAAVLPPFSCYQPWATAVSGRGRR